MLELAPKSLGIYTKVHENEGSTHQGEESLMISCGEVGDGALMI